TDAGRIATESAERSEGSQSWDVARSAVGIGRRIRTGADRTGSADGAASYNGPVRGLPDDFGLSKSVDSGVHSGPGLERLGCVGGSPPVVAPTGFESPKSSEQVPPRRTGAAPHATRQPPRRRKTPDRRRVAASQSACEHVATR